jgi:CRISPR-associated protein Cas2
MQNQVLLVYDIENDRLRSKIADACLDYGLDRIQFSAFAGKLSRNHQQELVQRIQGILQKGRGKIRLIPIADREWENQLEIENA